jgi:uncharacterized RDD family membrane protein YckC
LFWTALFIRYFFLWAYYSFLEIVFSGRTVGKFCTRTRAIRVDGQPFRAKDAIFRSLVRLVPFEAFSGFGVPWHDRWTDTTVVKVTG